MSNLRLKITILQEPSMPVDDGCDISEFSQMTDWLIQYDI